jgi:hypothetical protein
MATNVGHRIMQSDGICNTRDQSEIYLGRDHLTPKFWGRIVAALGP